MFDSLTDGIKDDQIIDVKKAWQAQAFVL
jgi:hypothetical protein